MSRLPFREPTLSRARRIAETAPPAESDPRVEALVNALIGRVADKWTMIVLEVLAEHGREDGRLRFTEIARRVPGISQKMLTQTLRGMERDGMLARTVHAEVPPRVDYRLTPLGAGLGAAFCGVWIWAEQNLDAVEASRRAFDAAAERHPNAAAERQSGTAAEQRADINAERSSGAAGG